MLIFVLRTGVHWNGVGSVQTNVCVMCIYLCRRVAKNAGKNILENAFRHRAPNFCSIVRFAFVKQCSVCLCTIAGRPVYLNKWPAENSLSHNFFSMNKNRIEWNNCRKKYAINVSICGCVRVIECRCVCLSCKICIESIGIPQTAATTVSFFAQTNERIESRVWVCVCAWIIHSMSVHFWLSECFFFFYYSIILSFCLSPPCPIHACRLAQARLIHKHAYTYKRMYRSEQ